MGPNISTQHPDAMEKGEVAFSHKEEVYQETAHEAAERGVVATDK